MYMYEHALWAVGYANYLRTVAPLGPGVKYFYFHLARYYLAFAR